MLVVGGALKITTGTTSDRVAVTLAFTDWPTIAEEGRVHEVTLAVVPMQARFTVPLKPWRPFTITGIVAATPLVTLNVDGTVTLKSPVAAPAPVRDTGARVGAAP